MPKRVKNRATLPKKRQAVRIPADANRGARALVDFTTQESDAVLEIAPAALSAYMAKLGAKGGKISGAKRMEMPAQQRKAIALIAARARWKKHPKG
jgi:hypothetical protein